MDMILPPYMLRHSVILNFNYLSVNQFECIVADKVEIKTNCVKLWVTASHRPCWKWKVCTNCEATRRAIYIVNLDPAAENFDYPLAMDIHKLISLEDVMDELKLSPNGGLVYCMEKLKENLDEWLSEELDNYMEDDYLMFDCPGQIELFFHVPTLKKLAEHLPRKNFTIYAVYMLDSQFITM
uniref:GPN-loop GTPase 3 n=1 Tax=Tanacetum cinerariifolium TaxID=118510 RepID=A0A6L2P129_TANCI|nr:GPN-loop GTPase 3-like [Tanacetum cinerariifolium]